MCGYGVRSALLSADLAHRACIVLDVVATLHHSPHHSLCLTVYPKQLIQPSGCITPTPFFQSSTDYKYDFSEQCLLGTRRICCLAPGQSTSNLRCDSSHTHRTDQWCTSIARAKQQKAVTLRHKTGGPLTLWHESNTRDKKLSSSKMDAGAARPPRSRSVLQRHGLLGYDTHTA